LIPQRNISLLSNRLAAGGAPRIREDVLERDYCLAWFLNALAGSDLRSVFAFKGGTALKRCYFGDYRFSEDLDFTLLAPMPFEDIRRRLEPVYAAGLCKSLSPSLSFQTPKLLHKLLSSVPLFSGNPFSPPGPIPTSPLFL